MSDDVTTRTAACSCGALTAACRGEPTRVSVCHCLACQRRTGSVYGVQARFPKTAVVIEGPHNTWTRTGDSGGHATFLLCPTCGSTIGWTLSGLPDHISIAVGAFADPSFPPPELTIYDARAHPWAQVERNGIVHYD